MSLNENDLRIDTLRMGPYCKVTITHLSTGFVAWSDKERSAYRNKKEAMIKLEKMVAERRLKRSPMTILCTV